MPPARPGRAGNASPPLPPESVVRFGFVRLMFTLYLLIAFGGVIAFAIVGLTHH